MNEVPLQPPAWEASAQPPATTSEYHPGGNPGENVKSISHRCYLREVAFEWELTKETICLPLGCLQGGFGGEKEVGTTIQCLLR